MSVICNIQHLQVSLEVRRDGNLARHLRRYGVENPEIAATIEQKNFTHGAAAELVGQFLYCQWVGGFWIFYMAFLLVFCFAYDQIRDAIFAEWDMFLWMFAAVVIDKLVVQGILLNTWLTDGTSFKKPGLFNGLYPIVIVWYIFIGAFEGINRFAKSFLRFLQTMLR